MAALTELSAISGPTPASFAYDAFGRRQQKTINGITTTFVYDGQNPVQQTIGSATVNLQTTLEVDEFLSRNMNTTTEEMLPDAVGSTVALADASGTVLSEYRYEPFGRMTVTGTGTDNEVRFTAREDDGTGLYHDRARYHHPGLQRFISEDPVGLLAGDSNFYVYVGNNPLRFLDPLGLERVDPFSDDPLSDEDVDEMYEAGVGTALSRIGKIIVRSLRLQKKVGGGGKLQVIDAKGRYAYGLKTTLQRDLYKSDAGQFITGYFEGLMYPPAAPLPPPTSFARNVGQQAGALSSSLFDMLRR